MKPREISGKANYLGYCNKLGIVPHWDELNHEMKEAWIAGAYETLMIKYIIETEGQEKEPA